MNNKFFTIVFILLSFLIKAQTIFTTPEAYDAMKQAGKLTPNTRYKFLESTQSLTKPKISAENIVPSNNKTSTVTTCQCMMPVDPTFSLVPMVGYSSPYRNDDASSANIPLGFNFCFYGTTYTSCYINNNGNITFVNDLMSFSAGGFPAGNPSSLDTIMIAPFWGDVDTRNTLSGLVYFKQTPTALIVKWDNVGYYGNMADKRNDFQLIITNGSNPILPNGNNVAFCYGDMQWTTGGASGGVGGFGGTPATAGVNKGDNTNYIQIGRFDKAGTSYDGPYGVNDGVSFLDNKSYFFNTCGTGGNLPPIIQDPNGGGSACGDTIRLCAHGDTLVYTTTFLAPELGQSISIVPSAPSLGPNFVPMGVTASSAGLTTFAWMVIGTPSITGVHTVLITGTDNGTPALSSTATYFIKILNITVPQPTLSISPAGTICATPGSTLTVTNCSAYDNVYWSNGASGCSVVANATGVYFVTVQKLGCYKSTKDSVFVFPNPIPVVNNNIICLPATSTTVSVNPPLTGMAAYVSYTWTPTTLNTPTIICVPGVRTMSVTDANGCKGSTTFTVAVSNPSLNIVAPDLKICPNECVKIKAVGTSSFTTGGFYTWSTSIGTTADTLWVCNAGPITIKYTDGKGCVATKTTAVINDVVPNASFSSSPPSPVVPGQTISFLNTSTIPSGSIVTSYWSFGDGGTATGNAVNHAFATAGNYTITILVTASSGCTDTASISYIVDALISGANVFTPNGDNVNETLKFKNLEFFKSNTLTILNRWGKVIYEKENYKNDWNGGDFSDGTYFYVLSIPEATPNIYKGFFQIFR